MLTKTLLALAPSPPDLAHSDGLKGDPGLPDRAYSGDLVTQENHVAVLVRSSTTVYSGRKLSVGAGVAHGDWFSGEGFAG